MAGAFHALGESEVCQVLQEVGCVGVSGVFKVVGEATEEDEGAGVEYQGRQSLQLCLQSWLGEW